MSTEDVGLQDAMERLALQHDYARFINHVAQRRNTYMESLSITNPNTPTLIAELQGRVQALNEVIRIRTDAADAKSKRTNV